MRTDAKKREKRKSPRGAYVWPTEKVNQRKRRRYFFLGWRVEQKGSLGLRKRRVRGSVMLFNKSKQQHDQWYPSIEERRVRGGSVTLPRLLMP